MLSIILWGIIGIVTLFADGRVSKLDYAAIWICYMLNLIVRYFE